MKIDNTHCPMLARTTLTNALMKQMLDCTLECWRVESKIQAAARLA